MAHPPKDITGQKFGKLTALQRVGSASQWGKTRALWDCECECGNHIEVTLNDLQRRRRTECGCSKHGMSRSKVYQAWSDMKQRCLNPTTPRFKDYGERGLKLDPDWMDFVVFYNELGDPPTNNHSLERINNCLGYVSGNVCWATSKQQANNRRSNHQIEYMGETMNLTEWAERLGMPPHTLSTRIVTYKWTVKRAFETPVRKVYRTGAQCPDEISDFLDDL